MEKFALHLMAAQYDRFLYRYTSDLNRDKIKIQRAYFVIESGDKRYTTPITSLFIARILINFAKVTGTSKLTRRLIAFVSENDLNIQRTAHLPYPPLDALLPLHIKEILAVDNVVCGNYQGESPMEKN